MPMYITVFLHEDQDSCAPAAVLQLCLAHNGQSIMCGSSLDWAVLSVPLFRQVQQSACQCHHVFITGKSHCRASRMCSYHILLAHYYYFNVSAEQQTLVSLCPSALSLLFICFFPFRSHGTANMSLQHKQN